MKASVRTVMVILVMFAIVIVLIISLGLFWANESGRLEILKISSFNVKTFVDTEDFVENLEAYLNQEINLKHVYICSKTQVIEGETFYYSIIQRENNKNYFIPIKYSEGLGTLYRYDLTGEVKTLNNGEYYFELKEIIKKRKKSFSDNLYYMSNCDNIK